MGINDMKFENSRYSPRILLPMFQLLCSQTNDILLLLITEARITNNNVYKGEEYPIPRENFFILINC